MGRELPTILDRVSGCALLTEVPHRRLVVVMCLAHLFNLREGVGGAWYPRFMMPMKSHFVLIICEVKMNCMF